MLLISGAIASMALLPLSLLYPRRLVLVTEEVPVTPPIIDIGVPIVIDNPLKPGESWSNPILSSEITPGYKGWFVVMTGDTLSKLAQKLGIGGTNWRHIVNTPENKWAVDLCSAAVRAQYYNGQAGINLVQRYGTKPGVNCIAPGYSPGYPLMSTASGSFPVLYFGGLS